MLVRLNAIEGPLYSVSFKPGSDYNSGMPGERYLKNHKSIIEI